MWDPHLPPPLLGRGGKDSKYCKYSTKTPLGPREGMGGSEEEEEEGGGGGGGGGGGEVPVVPSDSRGIKGQSGGEKFKRSRWMIVVMYKSHGIRGNIIPLSSASTPGSNRKWRQKTSFI